MVNVEAKVRLFIPFSHEMLGATQKNVYRMKDRRLRNTNVQLKSNIVRTVHDANFNLSNQLACTEM